MKAFRYLVLAILISLLAVAVTHAAEPAKKGRILYDTSADGTKQIEAALAQAQKENKNVQFHKPHDLSHRSIKPDTLRP